MDGVLVCVVRMHGVEFIHGWMSLGTSGETTSVGRVFDLFVTTTSSGYLKPQNQKTCQWWVFENFKIKDFLPSPETLKEPLGFHEKELTIFFGQLFEFFWKMKTWDYYYNIGLGYLIFQCSPLYIRNGYLIFWEPWLSIPNFKTDTRLGFGAVSNKHPTLETTQ